MREHFKVASLDGFGLRNRSRGVGAAGGILHYLTQHLRRDVAHLTRFLFISRPIFSSWITRRCGTWRFWNRCTRRAAELTLYGALNRTSRRWARGVCAIGCRSRWRMSSQSDAARKRCEAWMENSPAASERFARNSRRFAISNGPLGGSRPASGMARDLSSLRRRLEQLPG